MIYLTYQVTMLEDKQRINDTDHSYVYDIIEKIIWGMYFE
ncbi:hypothetical protein VCRA2119O147_50049 [Vibrio crassostreae]|nr:hypothetical protein VCRA2119O145_140068 [Vibrio crassostreae]CAK1758100.1 hypothetical protein VCRA2118O144_140024 [Vibrio crassostreae]CAK2376026.1 hypothetical protein VCRA2119O147_50049 [Vibrio crassostreae]CAK2386617.1 hypothetical protein VCRA2117O142_70024 [Vibrio crassostreae]CAK2386633.1 hypothetical protein VCRA2117O143_70023 [Vibrio crassostreae]